MHVTQSSSSASAGDAKTHVALHEPLDRYKATVLRREVSRLKLKITSRSGPGGNDHKRGYMALIRAYRRSNLSEDNTLVCVGVCLLLVHTHSAADAMMLTHRMLACLSSARAAAAEQQRNAAPSCISRDADAANSDLDDSSATDNESSPEHAFAASSVLETRDSPLDLLYQHGMHGLTQYDPELARLQREVVQQLLATARLQFTIQQTRFFERQLCSSKREIQRLHDELRHVSANSVAARELNDELSYFVQEKRCALEALKFQRQQE